MMFDYKKCVGCKYFEKEEENALRRNNSAFDAASDMWDYVDKCWKERLCPCQQRNERVSLESEKYIAQLCDMLKRTNKDSAEADALRAGIRALIGHGPKYVLSAGDTFSIDTTVYDSMEAAMRAMKEAYDMASPPGLDEDSDESYCGDTNAVLFTGENVYTWEITEVSV
ncbi:MAG: hypothetical protein II399_08770 [Lachnospiraceae bacterium]|nr:hypothetical protein [Lachnospiraceae bacterium]